MRKKQTDVTLSNIHHFEAAILVIVTVGRVPWPARSGDQVEPEFSVISSGINGKKEVFFMQCSSSNLFRIEAALFIDETYCWVARSTGSRNQFEPKVPVIGSKRKRTKIKKTLN